MAYSKVERHMWNDDKFRRFPRDVRDMWQYLLTTEHSNRLGMFVLDPLYAAADLSAPDDRWSEQRVLSAWEALADAGRIAVDHDVRLVLVLNHFKHNQPENPNVVKGALDELAALPLSGTLFPLFAEAVRLHLRLTTEAGAPFAEPWLQAVDERLGKGYRNGSGNGMPNPEPEPKPEPKPEPEGSKIRALRADVNHDAAADQIIMAANRGMNENTTIRNGQPIYTGHGSRQNVLDWLGDGVSWEMARDTCYRVARAYKPDARRPQIKSMTYFDGPVREAWDKVRANQTEVSDGADDRGAGAEARGAKPNKYDAVTEDGGTGLTVAEMRLRAG